MSSQASPVKWSFETKSNGDNKILIIASGAIDKGWVIYSQNTADGGPIPTSFEIDGSEIKFGEKDKAMVEFDELFGIDVSKFKNSATFTLEGSNKLLGKSASLTYMACDGSRCLPPKTIDFKIN